MCITKWTFFVLDSVQVMMHWNRSYDWRYFVTILRFGSQQTEWEIEKQLDTMCVSKKCSSRRFINFFGEPERLMGWLASIGQFTCKFFFEFSLFVRLKNISACSGNIYILIMRFARMRYWCLWIRFSDISSISRSRKYQWISYSHQGADNKHANGVTKSSHAHEISMY